ncbi:hypothetical protein ACFXPS_02210 [Nocardia sp. NPDC059091]|uniref:hypothetical protein n=1 Tax=unclassified Nocardia TaxID=2637762 RepID=UPI0036BCF710
MSPMMTVRRIRPTVAADRFGEQRNIAAVNRTAFGSNGYLWAAASLAASHPEPACPASAVSGMSR